MFFEILFMKTKLMILIFILYLTQYVYAAPSVLIDLSHEYTFKYSGDLPEGYLRPEGYDITLSLATLTPGILKNYNILVIEQATTSVPFTQSQVSFIKDFVMKGGGLFLVGKKTSWSPSSFFPEVKSYPLNDLAGEFGITFTDGKASLPCIVNLPGVSSFDTRGSLPGILSVDKFTNIALSDSRGYPIFALKIFGSGRVAVCGEDNIISYPSQGKEGVNKKFIQDIFNWLSQYKAPHIPTQKNTARILPENKISYGSVSLYYSSALSGRAKFLTDNYTSVYNELVNMMKVVPVYKFNIIALATGGGGYSGGEEIGIGILSSDSYVAGVLAHEMTHSFVLPGGLPGAFGEGWATLAAERVIKKLGYNDDERKLYETQFMSLDPRGILLDLNAKNISQGQIMAYMGKAMWIIESLEASYGQDFMAHLMPLHRQWVQGKRVSDPVTMKEFIDMMSFVAKKDLSPVFRKIGTKY